MVAFRHLPVHSLEDVTHNFEQLQTENSEEGLRGRQGPEGKAGKEVVLQAHLAVAEKLPNGKIKIDTVDFDTASSWEATNKRFQPKTKGYYLIRANVGSTEVLADGTLVSLWVMKNGSELTQPLGRTYWESGLAGNGQFSEVSAVVNLNGSTDYAEIAGVTAAGTNSPYKAVMQAFLIQIGPIGPEGKTGPGITYYKISHNTEVLATGLNEAGAAVQAGAADEVTFTVPAGGRLCTLSAQASIKNKEGSGGAAIYLDGTVVKSVRGARWTGRVGSTPFSLTTAIADNDTGESSEQWPYQESTSEPNEAVQLGPSPTLFLAEGSHTVSLRLWNEDRTATGRIKYRRLIVGVPA